jgi:hypothetical protein
MISLWEKDGDYHAEEHRQVSHTISDGDYQREEHRQVSHMINPWEMVFTKERIIVR